MEGNESHTKQKKNEPTFEKNDAYYELTRSAGKNNNIKLERRKEVTGDDGTVSHR